jgi:hypothetical protein
VSRRDARRAGIIPLTKAAVSTSQVAFATSSVCDPGYSPEGVIETGLTRLPGREKGAKAYQRGSLRRFSPVRFESAELRRFPANFQSNPDGFLCTSDYVAEHAATRIRV